MFVKRMSAYIENEAEKFGFAYIEMDNQLFGEASEKVMRSFGLSPG